jgi:hypothetical protein
MKHWNIWAVLLRPKDMKENLNRLNGVIMVVFHISLGWTGIWLYALTRLSWRRRNNRKAGDVVVSTAARGIQVTLRMAGENYP